MGLWLACWCEVVYNPTVLINGHRERALLLNACFVLLISEEIINPMLLTLWIISSIYEYPPPPPN